MQKTQPFISSVNLTCPRSWREMSQEQLRYVLHILSSDVYTPEEGKTMILLHLSGVRVRKKVDGKFICTISKDGIMGSTEHVFWLETWQVQDMIHQLEYIDSYDEMDVRLERIQGFKAVDAMLHRVRFHDYLQMEKNYQGYLATKDDRYALGLAQMLYPGGVTEIDDAERLGCLMWFSHVKKVFSQRYFRHFFKPAPVTKGKAVDWLAQTNAMIRALTGGDITKEQDIYDKDCWRALTELDAKALDAEELKKSMKK